ncbi:MAG: hypothetical protein CL933_13810, partial [Deltaproteobacteria bacterium]|nr:hypothetical protein [Deltaproteobacteria bacterium]
SGDGISNDWQVASDVAIGTCVLPPTRQQRPRVGVDAVAQSWNNGLPGRAESRFGGNCARLPAAGPGLGIWWGGLEPVSDSGGWAGHSVFEAAFLEALGANETVVDGSTVFSSIRRSVMTNSGQIPEYSDIRKAGYDGGIFLRPKSLPLDRAFASGRFGVVPNADPTGRGRRSTPVGLLRRGSSLGASGFPGSGRIASDPRPKPGRNRRGAIAKP